MKQRAWKSKTSASVSSFSRQRNFWIDRFSDRFIDTTTSTTTTSTMKTCQRCPFDISVSTNKQTAGDRDRNEMIKGILRTKEE